MSLDIQSLVNEHPFIRRALRTSSTRPSTLKPPRSTPHTIAALQTIALCPELKRRYVGAIAPNDPSNASSALLRRAVFALATAECTLNRLIHGKSVSRAHMKLSPSDFDKRLTEIWQNVSNDATDALFDDHTQGDLLLGSYPHMLELVGLSLFRAREDCWNHPALQMAVAHALIVRSITELMQAIIHEGKALLGDDQHTGELDACSACTLSKALDLSASRIRRGRAILELLHVKQSWPRIRSTLAWCHLTVDGLGFVGQPHDPSVAAVGRVGSIEQWPIDSNTMLRHANFGLTPHGLAPNIKLAVGAAALRRTQSISGGGESAKGRRAVAASLGEKNRPQALSQQTAEPGVPSAPKNLSDYEVSSLFRAALRICMQAMYAANEPLTADNVRRQLLKATLPTIRVGQECVEIGITSFSERFLVPGTQKTALYSVTVRDQTSIYKSSTFNAAVHAVRGRITTNQSQPG